MGQRLVGKLATTHKLGNGFQFTREDLEEHVRQMPPGHPFYFNHRLGGGPIAKLTKTWVGQIPDQPDHYAIFVELELSEHLSPDEAMSLEGMGLSPAFLGRGFANFPESEEPDLKIGIAPSLDQDLHESFQALGKRLGNIRLAVVHFHEHAAEPPPAIIVIVSLWLLKKVGDKIFDAIWDVLVRARTEARGKTPQVLKVQVRGDRGRIAIEVPIAPESEVALEQVSAAASRAIEALTELPNRSGIIVVNEDGTSTERNVE